jgi:hypothetical protein
MSASEKILWVVNYDTLDEFLKKSVEVGVTGVAIRTDNDLNKAIPAFHAKKIKVYGWRWPSAKRDACMAEANKAIALLANGLDGYFVDPEGAPGKPYDWDQAGLDPLAADFCKAITSSAPGKPFGTTSHYRGKFTFPKLPWASFFKFSSVLLPQAYWRSSEGTIGHGIPEDNYRVALDSWTKTGGDRTKIVPMAGELASSTAAEICAHVKEAQAQAIDALHFYAYEASVKAGVWSAVAKA